MVCRIEHFSEADFKSNGALQLHIEDDLKIGDEVYISHKYKMKVENMFRVDDKLTIVDGSQILKLRVI